METMREIKFRGKRPDTMDGLSVVLWSVLMGKLALFR